MGTRKVQRLGPSTLAMTLPAEWTTKYGIEKGNELTIHQGKGILTVTAETGVRDESEATVHVGDLGAAAIERAVIAQYVLGRRSIDIQQAEEALSNEIIDAVYRAQDQLMGLGVVEETPDRISVRCSVDPADFTLEHLLQRLERTGRTMRDEAVTALARRNPDLAQRALNRERQANKIFVLLLRLIYTTRQHPPPDRGVGSHDELSLIGYRSVAKNLELTADNAEDIAKTVLATDGPRSEFGEATVRKIRDFADQVDEITPLAVQSVIDRDFVLTTDVRRRFHEIGDREASLLADLPEMPNQQLLAIREVLLSLQETVQYAMRNAEIAANIALDEESEYLTVA